MTILYETRNQIEEKLNKNLENGFAKTELLPGTYELVKNYKCILKAGSTVSPEKFADKVVVYSFVKGTGYVTTDKWARNITEVAFFAPDFDKGDFSIHALTDLEFLIFEVSMTEGDWASHYNSHTVLPWFQPLSEAREYWQDCKGPNTRSWQVIQAKNIGRILLGVVKSVGEGTVEKGHPRVHQWNYCLDDTDMTFTVEDESVPHKEGDWSFVEAGLDHSLTAEPGKATNYIWFEHFVKEIEL